jgi:serine protease Do
MRVLPKLQEGDLRSGVLGVNLQPGSRFGQPASVVGVRPNSPAAKAGFQAGDRIVEVDRQPIERLVQLRAALNSRYAGERIQFVVMRGDQRVDLESQLVAELQPYQHPFLGILPQRNTGDSQGIVVRYVYPNSPAANAGIVAGDVLTALAGEPVASVEQAWRQLSALMPGDTAEITFRHGEQGQQRQVALAPLPEEVPAELPPDGAQPAADQQAPPVGRVQIKLAEFANECLAYVPDNFRPGVPHGLLLWLHGPGGYQADELVARWKPVCDQFHLILVAPSAADPAAWQPAELEFIKRALARAIDEYAVDRARVVAAGEATGAVLAYVLAFNVRDQLRGVVAINGTAGRLVDNEPLQRLAIVVADSNKSRFREQSRATVEKLRTQKFPVTEIELGEADKLDAEQLQQIGRWIDALDRI